MAILDQWGNPIDNKPQRQRAQLVQARYDAAVTTDDNRRHWVNADALSAISANSAGVRATLRERSRYEIANNSYARGIVSTYAAYMTGNGPTLQLSHRGEGDISAQLRAVERLWSNWAYTRKLAEKLHTMVQAIIGDGESFALMTSNDRPTMHTPVALDIRVQECDRFDNWSQIGMIYDDSGVKIDSSGAPVEYAYLDYHPGTASSYHPINASRWIGADGVIHLYRKERPEQLRGIPRTTPALPLFALLRRFTLATVTAAETAANFAAILAKDEAGTDDAQFDPWDRVEIERNAFLTTPGGTRLTQLKAEHPTTNHEMFVRTLLMEVSRAMGTPLILALGTAEKSNYASGRMDVQTFYRELEIERKLCLERECLDRLFEAWLDEALLIDDFLPPEFVAIVAELDWAWMWEGRPSVDRKKEADGQAAELANNTTTLAREYAAKGQHWEDELKQRAKELAFMREIGLSTAPPAATNTQPPTDQPDDGEDPEEDANEDPADELDPEEQMSDA